MGAKILTQSSSYLMSKSARSSDFNCERDCSMVLKPFVIDFMLICKSLIPFNDSVCIISGSIWGFQSITKQILLGSRF